MIEKWKALEHWICQQLKILDPYIKRTPGSGNGACKGDVKMSTNLGLHLEAKYRNQKSPYNQSWLDKTQAEIPLHVNKVAVVITENKEGKKVAHLDAEEFFKMFIKSKCR